MRLPLSRPKLFLVAGFVAAGLAAALGFGPLVRSRIAEQAARRHLDVEVETVRPGWFAVRLLNVRVRAQGVEAAQLHLEEVRVRLSAGLHLDGIEVRGGELAIRGAPEQVREEWTSWREHLPRSEGGATHEGATPLVGEGISARWNVDDVQPPLAELQGVGFTRDDQGLHVASEDARVRSEGRAFHLSDSSVDLDPKGTLLRAHAAALVVEWSPRGSGAAPPEPDGPPVIPPASGSSAPVLVAHTTNTHTSSTLPVRSPDAAAPLLQLPELHVLRRQAALLASQLSERLPEGATLNIDALTWSITPDEDHRVALTIGPGPFALTRNAARVELRFSTDPHASTSLSARVLLPTDGGDVSATLEGGPVSLSLLGIHEGAAGLVDVDKATATGTVRVTLAGDASAVTFDAQVGTRGLSVRQPRLALDVLRGIDLDVRARGAMTDGGEVRLDDFAATLGALHVAGSGLLHQTPENVAASLQLELPSTACQSLLDSVPTALLPALTGTKMSGTFGARGHFAFDTRALDDLQLDYDIQDQCRVTEVPLPLARERFRQPFAHRIYLPDGSTTEQSTGPGSRNWTSLGQISPYMQVAVMTTEDGAFLHHHGFNRSAIRASIVANLKARRFVRGASTITMQLAKNLFLARDKTLARKLEEVVLTDYLEQTFSKDELMELYLNVIEFGPAVYGITAAAEYYFGRSPSELNLAESLFLSSLLPAPLRYGSMRELPQCPDGWMRTLRSLMVAANKRGLVTDAELAEGQAETITFWHGGQRPEPRPVQHLRSRLEGNDDDSGALPASLPDSP
jgi:hypothetical protein